MNGDRTLEGVLRYYDLAPTTVSVTVRTYDGRARAWRAARVLAICWGLAAVSVLVPIAHFLLVPAFFLAGPLLAVPKLRERASVLSARGRCPACGEERAFHVHAPWKESIAVNCGACRRGLRLVLMNPAAAA